MLLVQFHFCRFPVLLVCFTLRYYMTFSFYLYCIHTWEFVLRLFHIFHLWLNLLSYHGDPSVFLLYLEAGAILVQLSHIDDCHMKWKFKPYLAFMFSCTCDRHLFISFLVFFFVACYFRHSTTHVIMLLIVLVSIESNFINISFPRKNNVISPYEKKIYPCVVTSKEELVSSNLFLIGQLTYFGICDI